MAAQPPPGAKLAQGTELSQGMRVYHSVFGEGTIERIEEDVTAGTSGTEVFVQFKNFEGAKKLVLKYAKLWVF